MGVEVFHALKAELKDSKKVMTAVGDEGGFAPNLESTRRRSRSSCRRSRRPATSRQRHHARARRGHTELFDKKGQVHARRRGRPTLDSKGMVELYQSWCSQFPIFSIEDGMAEDDWEGWQALTTAIGGKTQLVGDDLFVTNTERCSAASRRRHRQLDPDQGQPDRHADRDARSDRHGEAAGMRAVMSHRSGESEDTTIADLAVATGAGQIKTGAPCRSDRVAKYNQLLRIEEMLGDGRASCSSSIPPVRRPHDYCRRGTLVSPPPCSPLSSRS
jgi:enolase